MRGVKHVAGSVRATRRVAVGIALALVVALALGGGLIAGAQTDASDKDELSPEGQDVQALYDQLAQDLAEWDAQKEAEAENDPPLDPETSRPEFTPDEWPGGVFGKEEAEFPPAYGYEFLNVWRHSDEDTFWLVYAGSHADSKFGVILVEEIDPRIWNSEFTVVHTDIEGPLSIEGGTGMTLVVGQAGAKDHFAFDVRAMTLEDNDSGVSRVTDVTPTDL
jgi:outer membrane murein-binding lipoprotein Lpp